jgi:hypothetical protein
LQAAVLVGKILEVLFLAQAAVARVVLRLRTQFL